MTASPSSATSAWCRSASRWCGAWAPLQSFPALPLLLFEYPLHTLAEKVISRLIGL